MPETIQTLTEYPPEYLYVALWCVLLFAMGFNANV